MYCRYKRAINHRSYTRPPPQSPAVPVLSSVLGGSEAQGQAEVKKKRGIRDTAYALNHLLENLYIDDWDLIRPTVNQYLRIEGEEINRGERSSGFTCKRRRISL